jgi:hypothetical protein
MHRDSSASAGLMTIAAGFAYRDAVKDGPDGYDVSPSINSLAMSHKGAGTVNSHITASAPVSALTIMNRVPIVAMTAAMTSECSEIRSVID